MIANFFRTLALLIATAVLAGPATAQTSGQPAAPPPKPGVTADDLAKTADELARQAEELARQAGEAAKSMGSALGGLMNDAAGMVGAPNPTGHLPPQISDEDRRFFAILEAIGLRLKDVTVTKGMLGSANYRFEATREPTEAEIATAETLLRAYRDSDDGLRSRARQKIARSALDTVATAGYVLSGMEVTLSPWPDASYQITAKAGR